MDSRGDGRERRRYAIGAVVVLVIAAAAVAVIVAALTPRGTTRVASPAVSRSPSVATVFVHVVGAVKLPGIYRLRSGARVVDAIAAAGGFSDKADRGSANLARPLVDGEQLVIPERGAPGAPGGPGAAGVGAPGPAAGGLVNINTADRAALETLDGVGPALAQRILDYRKAHGPFSSVSQLGNVAGIGDKKLAALKGRVTT